METKAPKQPQTPTQAPQDRKVDVQQTWRKHGWKPLAERQNEQKTSK
jgi:hypothetical protein